MSNEAILIAAVAAVLVCVALLLVIRPGRGQGSVLADGVEARATVLSVQDTKTRAHGNPVALVRLDVLPPDGANYEVVVKQEVTRRNALMLAPGQVVWVRFNPENRAETVIVPPEG
ncbi:DUF3592 domain-containing protein [Acidocella sp. KAb 2-4]|uniref:DUF3592 domain-containing protein n=1 Tax=Acidocella sp. KAb 2-4 TaxID=2885158 RepID=UPI001D060E18|nr:DUF3592 domain-containing protein [Acidocella sp. KAb 2-4]MCB5944400.1 hypothetical protein [Acidocella sp. KAb 2-4]